MNKERKALGQNCVEVKESTEETWQKCKALWCPKSQGGNSSAEGATVTSAANGVKRHFLPTWKQRGYWCPNESGMVEKKAE